MTLRLPLRIGTRGSPLALAQAHQVQALLAALPPLAAPEATTIVVIRTTGDRITDRPLAEAGGKGLFTKEIEQALQDRQIDLAVHSMKDVPTWLPDGLHIPCMLPREDPRDALFARAGTSLATLPEGAVVGTASLRRMAQALARRPDLKLVPLRGNVGTRVDKLRRGEVDATFLALAGLRRLGRDHEATAVLSAEEMLPAVGQGAIGIECRIDDSDVNSLLAALNDATTFTCVAAERALLAVLDGSCRTPIAALARIQGARMTLQGRIARPDGTQLLDALRAGATGDARALGEDAGAELRARGGPDFFTAS